MPPDHTTRTPVTHHTGQYRLDLHEPAPTWWWSPQVFHIHGIEPGKTQPTTRLLLARTHPDDEETVNQALDRAVATGEPFAIAYRTIDTHGQERCVVMAGQGHRDRPAGKITQVLGWFVDITTALDLGVHHRARRDVDAAARSRSTIEQAKGIISLVYGQCPEEAFARLRRASNDMNVRIRDLADVIVDTAEHAHGDCAQQIDSLLNRR